MLTCPGFSVAITGMEMICKSREAAKPAEVALQLWQDFAFSSCGLITLCFGVWAHVSVTRRFGCGAIYFLWFWDCFLCF